ncbi:MAG: hypothetical protein DWI62_03200 [Chloroflexi bacterium]|nr:MAG: hypothetical protein DWI62_03200 [Chloroflexota bacterium]
MEISNNRFGCPALQDLFSVAQSYPPLRAPGMVPAWLPYWQPPAIGAAARKHRSNYQASNW